MSLLFWRKTNDTGVSRLDGKAQTIDVVVTSENPLPVQLIHPTNNIYPPVSIPEDSGFQAPIAGRIITRLFAIPGIGAGVAYADGDAFGTAFTLSGLFRAENPAGWICEVFVIDKDDEGLQVDVPIFTAPIVSTADNSAFAPTDIEMQTWRTTLPITGFYNYSLNQGGRYEDRPQMIVASGPDVYTQLVARGALNITAGQEPMLGITVLQL